MLQLQYGVSWIPDYIFYTFWHNLDVTSFDNIPLIKCIYSKLSIALNRHLCVRSSGQHHGVMRSLFLTVIIAKNMCQSCLKLLFLLWREQQQQSSFCWKLSRLVNAPVHLTAFLLFKKGDVYHPLLVLLQTQKDKIYQHSLTYAWVSFILNS